MLKLLKRKLNKWIAKQLVHYSHYNHYFFFYFKQEKSTNCETQVVKVQKDIDEINLKLKKLNKMKIKTINLKIEELINIYKIYYL